MKQISIALMLSTLASLMSCNDQGSATTQSKPIATTKSANNPEWYARLTEYRLTESQRDAIIGRYESAALTDNQKKELHRRIQLIYDSVKFGSLGYKFIQIMEEDAIDRATITLAKKHIDILEQAIAFDQTPAADYTTLFSPLVSHNGDIAPKHSRGFEAYNSVISDLARYSDSHKAVVAAGSFYIESAFMNAIDGAANYR